MTGEEFKIKVREFQVWLLTNAQTVYNSLAVQKKAHEASIKLWELDQLIPDEKKKP